MMGFHERRLNQQFLNFSDQLMLLRTFIQSRNLHLFPTSKAGTALPLVSFFSILYKAGTIWSKQTITVLTCIHVPSESGRARTGTCMFCMPSKCSI